MSLITAHRAKRPAYIKPDHDWKPKKIKKEKGLRPWQ